MVKPDQRLPKRINSQQQINRIRRQGRRILVPPLVVYQMEGSRGQPGLAIAITKRAGSATIRNYAKRRIREFFRCHWQGLGADDYLFFSGRDLSKLNKTDWNELIKNLFQVLVR